MFCYQCEQTAKGSGCAPVGVCGKDAETAALQDLIVYGLKGLSMYAHRARQLGSEDARINRFTIEALFVTVTNVNFDPARHVAVIEELALLREQARRMYTEACRRAGIAAERLEGPAQMVFGHERCSLVKQGESVMPSVDISARGSEVAGLEHLVLFGLKGMAAYADHAMILGKEEGAVFAFFHEVLDFLSRPHDIPELMGMAMRVGEMNLKVMEMLDRAHTERFGHPIPTPVRVTPRVGKAILVSGHDLVDLEALLKQTEGTGIHVYTHGEMLPAHGYPGLKKYSHLVGNYGGAWQDQRQEFDAFPGAILMTTNCIQKPQETYRHRIFTSGLVGWPGVRHIRNRDFGPVIEAARREAGFQEDAPEKWIRVGFGHEAILSVADKIVAAVNEGRIRHFFLVGGCDGAKSGRNYYTTLVRMIPKDSVILTLACGKYRFHKLDFGDIGGIPRLLDIGQCNDAYSAIQIAGALAKAFNTDVNRLPLSLILSWYEQKAVAILLTLLHLGIKNIRIGPTLPAFIAPSVLDILVKQFNLMPIGSPEDDLKAILG